MRKQFKDTLLDLAQEDENIILVFGDISVFLFREFQERHPNRFYNMGICEGGLVSISAGLSSQGYIPFVHSIAPFVTERCFEQVKLDFCYNDFPGNIVSCGGTFDYAWDGSTHHCHNDIACFSMLPGMEVFQPGSAKEADFLIRKHYNNGKSSYFRLSDNPHHINLSLEVNRGVVLRDIGADVTVITAGPLLDYVLKATEDIQVNILYFHTLKPLDTELLRKYSHTTFKVVHDAHGLYETIGKIATKPIHYLGLPDKFITCYGTICDAREYAGLGIESIKAFIKS